MAQIHALRAGEPPGRLPNFVIVGAMRSGTTSLARYLGAHPDVFMAGEKEVHFFDRHFDLGVEWYANRFALAQAEAAVGEATQVYVYDAVSVERMARVVPDAKLIAVLRDPVDRAYSHYWLNRSLRIEELDFPTAIDAEADRLASGDRYRQLVYSYADRGRYLRQLLQLCEHFPRQAVHVVIFDDLCDTPRRVYRDVCRFLGVDPTFEPTELGEPINRHVSFRSIRLRRLSKRLPGTLGRLLGRMNTIEHRYEPMEPTVRARLQERFRDENDALANWLGRDLVAWSAGEEALR